MEDVASEPTREVGNCVVTGDLTLKTGAKAISIYATASTIQVTEELSGDPDAEGIKTGIVFDHPGNSVAIKNFIEIFKNRGVIAIVQECDGTTAGRPQIMGRVCNPLRLSLETKMDAEATKRTLTSKQAIPDKNLAPQKARDNPELPHVTFLPESSPTTISPMISSSCRPTAFLAPRFPSENWPHRLCSLTFKATRFSAKGCRNRSPRRNSWTRFQRKTRQRRSS